MCRYRCEHSVPVPAYAFLQCRTLITLAHAMSTASALVAVLHLLTLPLLLRAFFHTFRVSAFLVLSPYAASSPRNFPLERKDVEIFVFEDARQCGAPLGGTINMGMHSFHAATDNCRR
jgi:hypothetical protein